MGESVTKILSRLPSGAKPQNRAVGTRTSGRCGAAATLAGLFPRTRRGKPNGESTPGPSDGSLAASGPVLLLPDRSVPASGQAPLHLSAPAALRFAVASPALEHNAARAAVNMFRPGCLAATRQYGGERGIWNWRPSEETQRTEPALALAMGRAL